jgi:hypothetical protein
MYLALWRFLYNSLMGHLTPAYKQLLQIIAYQPYSIAMKAVSTLYTGAKLLTMYGPSNR